MNIQIISPGLPPKIDGIGAYSSRVGGRLSEKNNVTIITASERAVDPVPGCNIEQIFSVAKRSSVRNILPFVEKSRPDWILLQYQSFSYGRWGLNLDLPKTMSQIKKVSPATKVLLMVHEPFVPNLDLKHIIFSTWQKWQLWSLGNTSDIIALSIEPWAQKFTAWFPGKHVIHLPMPSNIVVQPQDRNAMRRQLDISDDTIVLGVFGQAHASFMMHWLRPAAEAVEARGIKTKVLYIGPRPDLMKKAFGDYPFIATGALPMEDVSRHAACMDIFLSPFVDGVSTRRSSVMYAIDHGVALAGTFGYNTDTILLDENDKSMTLSDSNSLTAFTTMVADLAEDPARRARLGSRASEFYNNEFSVERLIVKLTSLLTTGDRTSAPQSNREKVSSI